MFALATLIHWASGAHQSGFGAFEDEPAHLVTSLMFRDWLAGGELSDPRGFAENYYVHYPKVAVGQWPPVFHGLLGLWMWALGTSTLSVMAFLSLVETLIAATIYAVLRRPLGELAGALAGAFFLTVPIVQRCGSSVMTEGLIALLGLGAVLAFGRYLDTGKARWVLAFAGVAAAALLTKGSALALGLVPPLAILLQRRFGWFLKPSLWMGAALVALLAGPWYYLTLSLSQGTWTGGGSPSWEFVGFAAPHLAGWLPNLAGWAGLVLVPVGMVWALRKSAAGDDNVDSRGRTSDGASGAPSGASLSASRWGQWTALAAWVPAILIVHLLVPSSVEERHFAVLAPAWTIFAALGAGALGRAASRAFCGSRSEQGARFASAAGVAALACAMWFTNGHLVAKEWSGWGAAATRVIGRVDAAPERLMIASDPVGEGLFVAGVALADEVRPHRLVMRASKVLGNAGWSGYDYEPRFRTVEEVDGYLREHGIGYVAIDESARGTRHWFPHMDQLLGALESKDLGWRLFSAEDVVRNGAKYPGALRTFFRAGWQALPRPNIRLEDVLRR